MDDLNFTPLEAYIYQASPNLEITRQRRRMVLITGSLFAAVLLVGTLIARRWEVPLCVGLLYIGMTMYEKIAYANAVIGYKSVVQKLRGRIEELESGGRAAAADPPPGR